MFICSGSDAGIQLRKVDYDGNLVLSDPVTLFPNCRNFTLSKDSSHAAFYTRTRFQRSNFPDKFVNVCLFNQTDGTIRQLQTINVPNIESVYFSPKGTYILIILQKTVFTDEQNIPLVQVFKSDVEGPPVRCFNYNPKKMPDIFWSDDETIFCSTSSQGVQFTITNPDGTEKVEELKLKNLLACDFSCYNNVLRFAVVYENNPHKFKIFQFPNLETPICGKAVMVGETFTVNISPTGYSATAVGFKNASENSNNYFGDSYPYYNNQDGYGHLNIKKSGPIHAVNYSLDGKHLILIAGDTPPSIIIQDEVVNTFKDLGIFSLNSIRFSPNNVLCSLGGFGSFAGEVKIVDLNTKEIISEIDAKFTSEWNWSPCGRLFYTAILFQKLQVQNEFHIHNHLGAILSTVKLPELTQVEWIGNINPLPLPNIEPPPKKEKPTAYVPPHLRKGSAPTPSSNGPPQWKGYKGKRGKY